MADEKNTAPVEQTTKPKVEKEDTVEVTSNGPDINPPVARARVQEGALVGDEAIAAADSVDLTPDVYSEDVRAQVTAKQAPEIDTVRVHEVHVAPDEVITDPSDPRAVQMPDAGRGTLSLPIFDLAGPTVEDVFAKANKDAGV